MQAPGFNLILFNASVSVFGYFKNSYNPVYLRIFKKIYFFNTPLGKGLHFTAGIA